MLLTQSQVSVLISSIIIFFFTVALFLAGYVLQQRTLNDLRDAIAPAAAAYNQLPEVLTVPDGLNKELSPLSSEIFPTLHPAFEENVNVMEGLDRSGQPMHDSLPTQPAPLSDESKLSTSAWQQLLNSGNKKGHHLYQSVRSTLADLSAPYLRRADYEIQRWIRRIQGKPMADWEQDVDESTPLEELSGLARRRRIKLDIRRLGVVEDGELRTVYRPRRRIV